MTVYVPTDVGERSRFLSKLEMNVPPADKLVIGGDWNVSLDEALRSESFYADRSDVKALLELCTELVVVDPFPMLNPGDPGYTWFSNLFRDRQAITRRRLDFFLMGEEIHNRCTSVRLRCSPLSDHKPVIADICLSIDNSKGIGFFRLNNEVLKEPGASEWVSKHMQSWERARGHFEATADWLDGGIAITSGVLDVISRILARERNKREAECKRRVEDEEERLDGHPISVMVWAEERERRMKEWDKLQEDKQKRWSDILRIKGIEFNDKMAKETFQNLQPRRAQLQMVELRHPFDAAAPSACSASGMLQYATRQPQDGGTTDLTEESDMWTDTKVKLQITGRLALDRPLALEETMQTLKSMAKGKSPGVDELLVEFYSANWEAMGPKLVDLYNELLTCGKLGKGMTHGVISVLFKKGDKTKVQNWRSTSLLNVSYKILAKSLARRLAQYLPELVKGDQGAFVKGRLIFNNIVTAIETLEVVQSEGLDMTVLLVDLEKTHDKVGWSFVLTTTLRWMGFGEAICVAVARRHSFSTPIKLVATILGEVGYGSRRCVKRELLRQACCSY
ncbi:hypothetical protein CBR_g4588 [Chara braunii]|uniref:Uncharacterized protein n=1 Tax=Chara braunii TaxID=69332 RepID=A0A388KIA6_CHABU|nr:hypothetical protein CBR_g4588 [Chara braunii]|eukprot:GBG69757.1 hypothetical protein CBR_g4588 [Chara braunii]